MSKRLSLRMGGALFVALLALFFVYPLLRFLSMPLWAVSATGAAPSVWGGTLPVAVRNTLALAVGAACLAAPLGTWLAWALERRRSAFNPALGSALWLIFLVPSYLLTTGWQIVFRAPWLHASLVASLFYGPVGIVALLALKALPFAVFVVRPTWAGMGRELEEAMHVHALPWLRRMGLTLRLALPAIGAGFVISFIESVQEFGIPATLGAHIRMPILTYAVYERLSTAPLDFVGAARLSWLLVAFAAGGALLHLYLHRRHSAVLVHGRARRSLPATPALGERLGLIAASFLLWGPGLIVPGAALVEAALGGSWAGNYRSIANSAGFAVLAASASLMLALSLALAATHRERRLATGIELFTLSNMAIPGLVLGAAYLMAFNTPWLPLYGTPLLLILGYTAGYAPMLTRLLQSPVAQIDRRLGEAARLHGLSWSSRVLDIEAVLLAAPLLRGWMLAFGFMLFELPVSELLYPAGRTPLAVAIVRLNQTLEFHAAARLALVGLALTAAVVMFGVALAYWLLPNTPQRVPA